MYVPNAPKLAIVSLGTVISILSVAPEVRADHQVGYTCGGRTAYVRYAGGYYEAPDAVTYLPSRAYRSYTYDLSPSYVRYARAYRRPVYTTTYAGIGFAPLRHHRVTYAPRYYRARHYYPRRHDNYRPYRGHAARHYFRSGHHGSRYRGLGIGLHVGSRRHYRHHGRRHGGFSIRFGRR